MGPQSANVCSVHQKWLKMAWCWGVKDSLANPKEEWGTWNYSHVGFVQEEVLCAICLCDKQMRDFNHESALFSKESVRNSHNVRHKPTKSEKNVLGVSYLWGPDPLTPLNPPLRDGLSVIILCLQRLRREKSMSRCRPRRLVCRRCHGFWAAQLLERLPRQRGVLIWSSFTMCSIPL